MVPILPLAALGNLESLAVRALAVLAVLLAAFITGCVHGARLEGAKHAEYVGKEAAQAVAVVVKQGEIRERVITRYFKIKAETETTSAAIASEVLNAPDSGACLNPDWRRLHDAAARGAALP